MFSLNDHSFFWSFVIAYQLENGIKIEILYAVHLNKSQSEGIFGVLIESQSGLGTRGESNLHLNCFSVRVAVKDSFHLIEKNVEKTSKKRRILVEKRSNNKSIKTQRKPFYKS